jgi:hypothetical protein
MSSDTDAAFVAIALALCLIHEKKRRWIKEWYKQRPQYPRQSHDRRNVVWA